MYWSLKLPYFSRKLYSAFAKHIMQLIILYFTKTNIMHIKNAAEQKIKNDFSKLKIS